MRVTDATIRSVFVQAYGQEKVSDALVKKLASYLEHRLHMPREHLTVFRVKKDAKASYPHNIEMEAEVPTPSGFILRKVCFARGFVTLSIHNEPRTLAPLDRGDGG